jgi:hypothetical protein
VREKYDPLAIDDGYHPPIRGPRKLTTKVTVEDVKDLAEEFTGNPNYEFRVRWYQFWRYHRVFATNYRECRFQDQVTADRMANYMRQDIEKEAAKNVEESV